MVTHRDAWKQPSIPGSLNTPYDWPQQQTHFGAWSLNQRSYARPHFVGDFADTVSFRITAFHSDCRQSLSWSSWRGL